MAASRARPRSGGGQRPATRRDCHRTVEAPPIHRDGTRSDWPSRASSRRRAGRPPARLAVRLRRAAIRPELASLAGVVVAFVFFSLATPLFLSTATFVPATSLAAQFGIVAVGVTLLMIGGQFDLSVGAIVGLTSWSMYLFSDQLGLPPELAVILSLGFGTALGLTNGHHRRAHRPGLVHRHARHGDGLPRLPDHADGRHAHRGQVPRRS